MSSGEMRARRRISGSWILDALLLLMLAGVALTLRSRQHSGAIRLSTRDWSSLLGSGRVIGEQSAPVTVVEFVDYECSVCASMEPLVAQIVRDHPGQIRVVVHHFPIYGLHPHAELGSMVVECAAERGRFAEVHRLVLQNQPLLSLTSGIDSLIAFANVGDADAFRQCVRSPHVRSRITEDRTRGAVLGVTGTPTFVVNGEWVGSPPAPALRQILLARIR